MTARPLSIVVLGLSLSSSWGNGHATTYRALLKGLAKLGHRVLFLERDVPWYAAHRDLPDPGFCDFALYADRDELATRFGGAIAGADAVIVGSYVPEGIEVLDLVLATARGVVGFYDIDTPITLAALGRGEESYIARAQIPRLDAYFSFTGGPTLRRLETEFGAAAGIALYCSADDELYRPTEAEPIYDLGYLGTYSPDRQPLLEELLLEPARRMPGRSFVVAGSRYPDDIAWPANVERVEHVAPHAHAAFYRSQRFTLNLTRADMTAAGWSPSVRLFEAGACGTPVISDWWEGLDALFPVGTALLVARTADDVCRQLEETDEAGHAALAATARAIVRGQHTGEARAAELCAALEGLAAARSGVTRRAS